jgi:uncharacterized protein YqiB (DUF1249 family)
MTIRPIENSQRMAAKVAGFSFLFSMAIVVVANYALLNPLIVPGNAVETARNIMAHQLQFRVTVTCFLIYSANVIVLLAGGLKPVEPNQARAGVA